MSQSKISQMKQKVVSKLHRQKTDTSHMTGKNTDLPATRSALNSNHSMGSRFPSENPNHEHNPGVITATQSTHFDHASHVTDQVRQNPDHIIRQDSEEGLYDSQKQYPSQTYTSTRAPIATGIPTTLPSTASYASQPMVQPMVQPIAQPIAQPIVAPMASSMTTMSTSSVAPTTFTDSVEKYDCEVVTKPAIVHEVIKNEELHQVQPVIERTREQTDIYEVVQPISEREIRPTEVRVATLPAKHIPIVRETEFIESQATIPVQIVKTIHVPVSQLTQVTTTRMMSTQEARSYETTQMSGQFMEKTQLNPTLLTQSTLPAQQSSTF